MSCIDEIQCKHCDAKLELIEVSTGTPGWKEKISINCSACGGFLKTIKTDGDIEVVLKTA